MLENRALEIIIIAAVVLLLFGAKRLPDTARGLGKSLRIFKSEVSAMKTDAAEPGAAPRAGVQTDAPEAGGQVAAAAEPARRAAERARTEPEVTR
ncbi:Sec-independent protein translocase subunit TatA [Streptomyces sp. NPDC046900]|uniref:Sec-independent protein translocase subunit TatA n=1 Tax=Streptomyces sp. NPDC046900 TaxID=3155473 RepID=UPI0033C22D2E